MQLVQWEEMQKSSRDCGLIPGTGKVSFAFRLLLGTHFYEVVN